MKEYFIVIIVLIVCIPIIILCTYKTIQFYNKRAEVDGILTDDTELIRAARNIAIHKKYYRALIFEYIFAVTSFGLIGFIIKSLRLTGVVSQIAIFLLETIVLLVSLSWSAKIWMCPHCKEHLPYKKSAWGRYTIEIPLITRCPHCNRSLID